MASSQKFRDYVVNQFSGKFSVKEGWNSPMREQNQCYIFLKKKYKIQIS